MPAPTENLLLQPAISTLRVELEPAHNAFQSLVLLAKADEQPGSSQWVEQTYAKMTPEERQTNRLVMIGLYFSITPAESWSSFQAYLDHLDSLSAESLRDRMLSKYASLIACTETSENAPADSGKYIDFSQVLRSPEQYLDFLRQHFDESYIDEDLETQAFAYITDLPKLKPLILDHLRHMWEKYLSAEWERTRPILQDSVNAFRQVDLASMDPLKAASFITGHELNEEKWAGMLENARQIIFIPSMHIGPYLWRWDADGRHYILFGARLPSGVQYDAPDLSRAEIIVRLNALADDSRLRILRYTAENGEQRAQDLIQMLDLSQSAVSRHLQQLTATGYLSERRCEGGKCYQLNPERIRDTLQAVDAFLKVDPLRS